MVLSWRACDGLEGFAEVIMAEQEVKSSKTVKSLFSRKRSTSEPNVHKDAAAKREDIEGKFVVYFVYNKQNESI